MRRKANLLADATISFIRFNVGKLVVMCDGGQCFSEYDAVTDGCHGGRCGRS